jgi:hypothetical protein
MQRVCIIPHVVRIGRLLEFQEHPPIELEMTIGLHYEPSRRGVSRMNDIVEYIVIGLLFIAVWYLYKIAATMEAIHLILEQEIKKRYRNTSD